MGKKSRKPSGLSAMLAHPLVRDIVSDLIAAAVVAALTAVRNSKRVRQGAERAKAKARRLNFTHSSPRT